MRYDIRDRSGKFIKVERIDWSKESFTMVIDNETHEPVQETTIVPVTGDENVIREKMKIVTDWLVGFSSYDERLQHMETEMTTLKSALENAEQRVQEANVARDNATTAMIEAQQSATMAREAYVVVDKERTALKTTIEYRDAEIVELKRDSDLKSKANNELFLKYDESQRLLEVAREERNRFREDAGAAEALLDSARDDHAKAIADRDLTIFNLTKERDGFHHKANGLEDENKRLQGLLDSHRMTLSNVKAMLN